MMLLSCLVIIFTAFGVWPVFANYGDLRLRQEPDGLLPNREPFGFGHKATGGGKSDAANYTYVVETMMDLREVLRLSTPRTVYVKGEIKGNQINHTAFGNCQYYIDKSSVKDYNFTLYLMSTNQTYTDAVEGATAANEPFEGKNASEYLNLLNRQNGWRGTAQNVQKSWESIDVEGNLTLIGWDCNTYLNGVSLIFNSRSNIVIRNIRISPPRDCFPAPESYPSTWNARYDAVSFVNTQNAWLDGNIFEDGPTPVAPDPYIWGWQVDRYDGLFDVEDGSDNITFSHNIVANHHKSLLWGGGEKEGYRDIGKMRFTVFGNHFVNSLSRNPLMRFGTFYIINNVFSNYQNQEPLYSFNGTNSSQATASTLPKYEEAYMPDFQYDIGIYNLSSVLLSGNYYDQTGGFPDDQTRLFTFSNLATPGDPAIFCSPADLSAGDIAANNQLSSFALLRSVLNGKELNMTDNVSQSYAYYIRTHEDSVKGGVALNCTQFEAQDMPTRFATAEEVLEYVNQNAGQLGKNEP
ncbi:pectin lyase fold/virulence factor [Whalleya microplaca]|nr:pectin lyase fold/virulence factor [Whalleya microplaca]